MVCIYTACSFTGMCCTFVLFCFLHLRCFRLLLPFSLTLRLSPLLLFLLLLLFGLLLLQLLDAQLTGKDTGALLVNVYLPLCWWCWSLQDSS